MKIALCAIVAVWLPLLVHAVTVAPKTGSDRCVKYEMVAKKRTWADAALMCEEKGMILARDFDDRSHKDLVDYIVANPFNPRKDFWINGKKNADGNMQTGDGLATNNTFYDFSNPSGNGDCLHLWKYFDYKWDDDACNKTKYFICERTCGDCLKYKVVNGNKLPWDQAALACVEDDMILARDLNSDTHNIMVDLIESKNYAPPKDVWINGIMNGNEVMEFTDGTVANFSTYDETNPSRNGDCLQLWTEHGYKWDDDICIKTKYYMCERECCGWYEVVPRKLTWAEATAWCAKDGLILARDLNIETHNQIVARIEAKNLPFKRKDFWLNGKKNWAGKMESSDKLTTTFTNYDDTVPVSDGDCLHMSSKSGYKWNHSSCESRKRFVCEKICF
ncbi:uncharacterized protein [Ptychodera flava]|uniref:uncharacterized protein n=1 Tax=Ptychodera flava TaxID=63121 RepID=UPI003969C644